MKKGLLIGIVLLALGIVLTACSGKTKKEESTTKHIPDEKVVAIQAGEIKVYLDEAKYYAYTAQATYETYYLTQNKEIDWEGKMTKGSSWETVVKGQVLDEICKRECLYALAEQYNVQLDETELMTLKKMVRAYEKDTNEELKTRIGIQKERLAEIFEKNMVAQKVEGVLEAMSAEEGKETKQNKKADAAYEEWKESNTIMPTKDWENIRFSGHIFTKEDLTNNQVLVDETDTK
ncbi:MAG: hypothetical protein K6G85_04115 [Eubacterium sp.]|nr:hypothetical protein [Eubacterium sp.]